MTGICNNSQIFTIKCVRTYLYVHTYIHTYIHTFTCNTPHVTVMNINALATGYSTFFPDVSSNIMCVQILKNYMKRKEFYTFFVKNKNWIFSKYSKELSI